MAALQVLRQRLRARPRRARLHGGLDLVVPLFLAAVPLLFEALPLADPAQPQVMDRAGQKITAYVQLQPGEILTVVRPAARPRFGVRRSNSA